MNTIYRSSLAVVVSTSLMLSGCATINGSGNGSQTVAQQNSQEKKIFCGLGAAGGAIAGWLITKSATGAGVGAALGCGSGFLVAQEKQLSAARELQREARLQGLQPKLVTHQVDTGDEKQPQAEAMERFVLPLNSTDVASEGNNSRQLLVKAASIASADTTGQKISITEAGNAHDRAWMRSVLTPLVKSTNSIIDKPAISPSIELSPVPTIPSAK